MQCPGGTTCCTRDVDHPLRFVYALRVAMSLVKHHTSKVVLQSEGASERVC